MKRNNFTLFEILLVIMLIGIISGSISMAFPKMIRNERFESSCKKVEMKILAAFEVMLDYDTDVIMTFEETQEGIMCRLYPIKPLPQRILNALNKDNLLKGVHQVTFSGTVPLDFNAQGSTPFGTLTLEGPRKAAFHLKGFPTKLVKGDYEDKTPEKTPYPQELSSA